MLSVSAQWPWVILGVSAQCSVLSARWVGNGAGPPHAQLSTEHSVGRASACPFRSKTGWSLSYIQPGALRTEH